MELAERNQEDHDQHLNHLKLDELAKSQRAVAVFMNNAYKAIVDHPKVFHDVHMLVNDALKAHFTTCDMMRTFESTLSFLKETLIPMALDAIDFQDRNLLGEAFGRVITKTEALKDETKTTRTRYMEVEKRLKELCLSLKQYNEQLRTEIQIKEAKESKELEAEKQNLERISEPIEDQNESIELEKGTLFAMSGEIKTNTNTDKSLSVAKIGTLLLHFARQFMLLFVIFQWVYQKGEQICSSVCGAIASKNEDKPTNHLLVKDEVNRKINEKREVLSDRQACSDKLLEKKEAEIGYFMKATEQIGDIISKLKDVERVWESMKNELQMLTQKYGNEDGFKKMMEEEKGRTVLKDRFNGYDKECCRFIEELKRYIQYAEKETKDLYDILFWSIGDMINTDSSTFQEMS